jgi:alpha-tubulin suppressor-like RCC1 family protein
MKKFMNIKNRSEFICGKLLSFFLVPIVMVAIFPTEMFSEKKVTKVAVGANHTLILKQDSNGNPGTLWAMGDNQYGQLGDGTTTDRSLAVEVKVGGEAVTGVTDIAAGDNHSFYIKSDGSLWAMGLNASGQLGNGNTTDQPSPIQIPTTGVAKVAAGANHSLVLKSDGSLLAMGLNASGQLGDETTDTRNSPVTVKVVGVAVTGVTQITAGGSHSMFIKSDGSLWAMGLNSSGQLGDGDTANRSTPYEVETNGVTKIAAGSSHSLYVKNNYLWAMGENSDGQLGDSTVWDRNRPILVPGIEGSITNVIAGGNHSFYVRQNGTIWAMGSDQLGQLGVGDDLYKDKNVSVQIPDSTDALVATGPSHSFLLKPDGSLLTSGLNANGQLGTGNTSSSNDFQDTKTKAYVLKISPTPTNGSATISGNDTHFAYNDSASISASPSNGYIFSGWSGDITESTNSYSFNVIGDYTFTAIFGQDTSDSDNDGLSNYEESLSIYTDKNKIDTDGDGFTDYEEYSTAGLNLDGNDSALRSLFLTKETTARTEGETAGIALVTGNPSNFTLFTQTEKDAAQQTGQSTGIAMVQSNPGNYSLYNKSEFDQNYATGVQDGNSTGYTSGYSKGFSDGNSSGVAYVQANPEKFNFLTDAEKNASYDLGYTAGLAEAEAAGLGEAQAKLALENLSSFTYLDLIRDVKKPHTDGWYFQPGLGWIWTNRETFPFLYRQAEDGVTEGWLYFSQLPEQIKKPYYDYNAEKWISASGN